MRIGVYVGTFNPVHKGHIEVINHLLNDDYVDKVLVIPTGDYWDKTNLIDVKKRIEMFKLYENEKIIVNDVLNNLPFTYLILNELKKEYVKDDLYLIIGADNIPKFHLWKEVDEILKNNILVLPRDNINIEEYLIDYDNKDHFKVVKDFEVIDISSTMIRDNINKKDITKYIDDKVLKYIKENNLY